MSLHDWFHGHYIRIGNLEIYFNRPFAFTTYKGCCGCEFMEFGFLGLTWLYKDCIDNSKE